MMYSHVALRSRGAHTYALDWQAPTGAEGDMPTLIDSVATQVQGQLDKLDSAGHPPLLVGKSVGCAAATIAARSGLPAIWFSPYLTEYPIVQALRRTAAPYLLVGGTADPMWISSLAAELPGEVCEIPGADHGLFIPGRPLNESTQALGVIMESVEMFLDTLVWPRGR